ncbi:hypothetical protein ACFE04_003961 [Oxalis oulophora]
MLLQLQSSLHSLSLSSSPNFLNGTSSFPKLPSPTKLTPSKPFQIMAMKTMQGRVVCAASDKTVAVEVTRLAPHPKYKRRIRLKKKYQAHDPLNQFKVGDLVQLEKGRPISKTKTFVAIQVPVKVVKKNDNDLGLPLQSQQVGV